jgi:hypothetical protein
MNGDLEEVLLPTSSDQFAREQVVSILTLSSEN